MTHILHEYIITYGYLAIFLIVLLQELGMPGLPNEWVLLYFGYLGNQSGLSYPLLLCFVVLADITGSLLLYGIFFHAKEWLLRIKPRWLPIPVKKIRAVKQQIIQKGGRQLLVAKLTPFVRSYLPVAAGLLQVKPELYSRIVFVTALIWSGGWVTAGWLLGNGWH